MSYAPAGKYHQDMTRRALRPFQAWQSLNSVTGACSSPYSVVGAAFNPPGEQPDTDIRQPLHLKERLLSSTMAEQAVTATSAPYGVGVQQPCPTRRP